MKKVVVILIVALIAAFVLVNVFAKPGAVTLRVYTDGDPFGVLDAAAYVIEPLDGVEGSEEYIAAACEDALRREGRGGRVNVKIDGDVVTVTVDGSTRLAVETCPGGAVFGLARLLGE